MTAPTVPVIVTIDGESGPISGVIAAATRCVSVELGVEPVDGTGDLSLSYFDVTQ